MTRHTRGMALLAVLGICAILVTLAVGALWLTQQGARSNQRESQQARQRWREESVLTRIAQLALDTDPKRSQISIDQEFTAEFDGEPVKVLIELLSGRVDINVADPILLAAVLRGHGISRESVQTIIGTWRGAAAAAQVEASESSSALPYAPNSYSIHRFRSVGEAIRALSAADLDAQTIERVRCLSDALTVVSAASWVDENRAVPAVKVGLQWADEQQWLGRRWLRDDASKSTTSVIGPPLRIRLSAGTDESLSSSEWIVRITGDRLKPYRVIQAPSRQRGEQLSDCSRAPTQANEVAASDG